MMVKIDHSALRRAVILPGMGADSSMYPKKYYRHLSWVEFLDWPSYRGERRIEDVAKRVIDEYDITAATIVGGSSLGGMVAVEIARLLNADRVILIGSTAHPRAFNPVLTGLSGLARFAQVGHLKWLAAKLNRAGDNLFLSMFEHADDRFMKAMVQAIGQWRGMDDNPFSIRHIHGARDKVIRPPSRGATIVPHAGHLLPMTHADVVARFIARHTAWHPSGAWQDYARTA